MFTRYQLLALTTAVQGDGAGSEAKKITYDFKCARVGMSYWKRNIILK